jgi:hypothetical protein
MRKFRKEGLWDDFGLGKTGQWGCESFQFPPLPQATYYLGLDQN